MSSTVPVASQEVSKDERILEAAVRVFAERGYHGSTMAEVARAADVATGTIYLYFERKQDLLIELFRRHLAAYIESAVPAIRAQGPGPGQLRAVAASHLGFFDEDRDRAAVFQVHAREPDPVLAEGIRPTVARYFEVIADVIRAGVDAGAFRSDLDVRLARQVFFGALDEVVTGWLRSSRSYSLMSVLDPVSEMLIRAFAASEAGDPS